MNELCPSTFSAISPVLGQGLETGADIGEIESKVETVTEAETEPAWVVKDWESSSESAKSDEIQSMIDSSDAASRSSVDSIAQNADYVGFD